MKGRRTSTSNFGVGARESHDASGFYGRFRAPDLSTDDQVLAPVPVGEPFLHGDARAMTAVADGSVALVVTSPPYFAGKQYEEELERDGIPASYIEYLQMLTDVFAECVRTLEPGGRIAVNVANLGRKPYRSLSADVISILQNELGLLLRGELIWQKGEGASSSCAWGSFRSATNPVFRDITERVVIASKGRFDRALSVKQRQARGLPYRSTQLTEDFLASTLDVWSIPPESARRVGHPAPFPTELPRQLIQLYTFEHDLVLDPFMGSGSTMVASALTGRRFVGYDLDPEYVAIARARVDQVPPVLDMPDERAAAKIAADALTAAGFTQVRPDQRIAKAGLTVSFVATDASGRQWYFDVAGPNRSHHGGMLRNDVVWRAIGRATAARGRIATDEPYVLLTTHLPTRPGEGDAALRASAPAPVFDVVDLLAPDHVARLRSYAAGGHGDRPLPGFWREADLES